MVSTMRQFVQDDQEAAISLSLRAHEPEFASLEQILGPELFGRLHPDWRTSERKAIEAATGDHALTLFVGEVGDALESVAAVECDHDRRIGWMGLTAIDADCHDHGLGTLVMEFGLNLMKEAGMAVAYFQTLGHPAQAPLRGTYEATGATLMPTARYFKALEGELKTGWPSAPPTPSARAYQREDQAAVVRLSLRSWEPVFASLHDVLGSEIFLRLHPDWRVDQQAAVEATCATAGTEVLVAEVDGVSVGFVAFMLDGASETGEVEMLAVDPDYQRRGIGLTLTELALASMERAGMRAAVIETGGDPGHAPARATYEAAGCTRVSIDRFFKAL